MVISRWENLEWDIPLETPPEVVSIAKNVHGFQAVDRFLLRELWTLHVYGYSARVLVAGEELPIRPGFIGVNPPNTITEYHYQGLSAHIYIHFRMPSKENPHRIRAMQDTGERYDDFYQRLAGMINLSKSEPDRVNARVWDILWDLSLASTPAKDAPLLHPAVQKAMTEIAENLGGNLSVEELAESAGVSYSYLAQLFQQAHGETVVGYIRRLRMERAIHLLERSTLPIKVIAASVGIPDLQHFNKVVRTTFGRSPRELRPN